MTRRSASRVALAAALTLACALVPAPARATLPALVGLGARPIALGGAYVAVRGDALSAFHNPAGLSGLTRSHASIGYLAGWLDLDLEVGAAAGAGMEAAGSAARARSRHLEDPRAIELALGTPATWLGRPVGLAGVVLAPQDGVFSLTSRTEPEPTYVRYDDVELLHTFVGAGMEILDGLSVGAGLEVHFSVNSTLALGFDVADAPATGRIEIDAPWELAPTAGVQWAPIEGWTFGVSYRGESRVDVEDFSVLPRAQLGAALALAYEIDVLAFGLFTPQQVGLGVAWRPAPRWDVMAELTWSDWSSFGNPFLRLAADGHAELGGARTFPLAFTSADVRPPRPHDTWAPRIGVEHRLEPVALASDVTLAVALRGGAFWEASPMPAQPGAATLVDHDRYVLSFGVGLALPEPFGWNEHVALDLAVQHAILPDRVDRKRAAFVDLDGDGAAETAVVGYPEVRSSGRTWAASASLSIGF